MEYDKQQEDKQQLFSGIEISFKERGKDLVCVVKQEPDTPDSVVDKILKREEFYGKRDITFKDIRHNANVKDMEGMLNALLTDMTKKYEFRWKINTACEKVFIASPSQPIVDKVSSEIKSGLDARCMFLLGTTKKEIYVKQLMAEMNETFGDKVQVGFDPDVWRLNLVGLQKSVAAALKDFSIISKTIHVDSSDKLKFIDTELDKRVDVSHTKLVQIERKENKGKMGFVIHGPSNQVYFLSQKIGEIQNECDISDVDIKDYNSLTYLRSSAGDDFMKRLAAEQNVNINRNWSDEAMSKDIFPTTHTLPTGHQIVLTSLTSTGPKVNFEVSGYSAGK